MKQSKYIWQWCLLVLLGLGIVSCTQENIEDPGPEPPVYEGTGFLSLQGNFLQGVQTRTIEENEDFGSVEENRVNHIRLVLYDGTDGVNDPLVRYAFDFDIVSKVESGEITGYEQGADYPLPHLYESVDKQAFVTYAREVERAPYKLLMLINPTGDRDSTTNDRDLLLQTAVGKPLSEFQNAVKMTYQQMLSFRQGGVAQNDNFVMTNHQGLVDVSVDQLYETPDAANNNPVPVFVSRVVAKVSLFQGGDFEVVNGTFEDLRWDLDRTNQQTYWMRKMTNYAGTNTPETQGDARSMRERHYAIDPNFNKYPNLDAYNDHFFSYKEMSITPNLINEREWEHSAYCLENTMNAASQKDATLRTAVLIKGNYVPTGWNAGDGYFIYNGFYITVEKMEEYAYGWYEIPPIYGGLGAAIQEVKDHYSISDFSTLTESFEIRGLKYYHEGISYYTVPIRHYGTDESVEGYYGVVRNFHYSVIVDKIWGPGSPTLEEEDLGHMSVRITILPWYDRQQGNNIGDPNDPSAKYYDLRIKLYAQDPDNPNGAPIYLADKYPTVATCADVVIPNFANPGDAIDIAKVRTAMPQAPYTMWWNTRPTEFTAESPTEMSSEKETVVSVVYPLTEYTVYVHHVTNFFGTVPTSTDVKTGFFGEKLEIFPQYNRTPSWVYSTDKGAADYRELDGTEFSRHSYQYLPEVLDPLESDYTIVYIYIVGS